MVRAVSPGGRVCLALQKVALEVRMELSQIVPETQVIGYITALKSGRKAGRQLCYRTQVVHQVVAVALRVS
jgi:hypothetical protein